MRLLLDTHVLLWALVEPGRMSEAVRDIVEDTANDVFFSAVSIWEIAIKAGLGRADFEMRPETILHAALEGGFAELVIHAETAILVADLPPIHRDPFDRLLIAQAMAGPLRLYTADKALVPYSDLVTLIA